MIPTIRRDTKTLNTNVVYTTTESIGYTKILKHHISVISA
jgi:hypothetical protein